MVEVETRKWHRNRVGGTVLLCNLSLSFFFRFVSHWTPWLGKRRSFYSVYLLLPFLMVPASLLASPAEIIY
jgi:hypothetical protein